MVSLNADFHEDDDCILLHYGDDDAHRKMASEIHVAPQIFSSTFITFKLSHRFNTFTLNTFIISHHFHMLTPFSHFHITFRPLSHFYTLIPRSHFHTTFTLLHFYTLIPLSHFLTTFTLSNFYIVTPLKHFHISHHFHTFTLSHIGPLSSKRCALVCFRLPLNFLNA